MRRSDFLWTTGAALTALPVNAARRRAKRDRVTVTVQPKQTTGESRLEIGITHTQYSLDTGGDLAAVDRGKSLLTRVCRLHNVHIMGWGVMNPSPAPGVYDWETLDRRMAMVRSIPNAVPVLTLCACPDWMKGGAPGTTNWKRIEAAPLPEHYDNFARLAASVARRYPQVRYFQVWNEMKGMWNAKINNWDFAGYTRLYNACYAALKSVNRANQVGGPYLVIEGTGAAGQTSGVAESWAREAPVRARQWEVIDYWLKNKTGADFLTLDRGLTDFHDKTTYSLAERARLTHWFGDIARQVRARPGAANLPLWWAEFYASEQVASDAAKAALNASAFRAALLGGSSVVLLWQPMNTGEVGHALFSDVRQENGGQPTALYDVVRLFREYFGPGTPLVAAHSSSPDVEVLARPDAALLINKTGEAQIVQVNKRSVSFAAFAVRLIPVSA